MTSDNRAVAAAVDSLTRAWLEGRYSDIGPLVHDDVVIVPPGGAPPARGREAFVRSFADFGSAAKIHDFSAEPAVIDSWGSTAVAYCPFTIDYEISSGRYRESGVDLLVFTKAAGGWQICWRTMISQPEAASSKPSGPAS
jgi:ketosteroid isomerase-like protein